MGPPLRLGLGTLGEGAPPLALGGTPPPWPPPPLGDSISRAGAPPGGLYKGGGREGSRTPDIWRLPTPLATPLPPVVAWRSPARTLLHPPPRRRAAGSSSTSPFPLLDQEGGDVIRSVRVLNAEVLSVQHLVIDDLDHGEYDYLNPVLLNASARDLQRYVDALLSLVAR